MYIYIYIYIYMYIYSSTHTRKRGWSRREECFRGARGVHRCNPECQTGTSASGR